MTLAELRTKYAAILEGARTANRSLTAAETTEMDNLKAEITRLESEAAEGVRQAEQQRSAAAARLNPAPAPKDLNTHLRSIAKGSADVGDKEVVADIVRVYEAQSPIFAAHNNKQLRLTGNTYSYPKITPGGAGYVKAESAAGTTDSASAITMVNQTFVQYSSQSIPVSQEMLDDAGFDVGAEVTALGMGKSTQKFDDDAVAALESYDATPTETAATSWALSDIVGAYFELPNRNRVGVKYIGSAATIKAIVSLLTTDNAPQAAIIGLTAENMIVDDNVSADLLLVTNPTLSLAIGMKANVRVFVDETSAGRTYEVQPRLAVGLRDVTAVAGRKRKAA